MELVPFYVSLIFIVLTIVSLYQFYQATHKNKGALTLILAIALLQAVLSQQDFYLASEAIPPRILFLILPSLILILIGFFTEKGKRLIAHLDLEKYTYLHTVRIGVEVVLFWLYLGTLVPESMTFAGRNFDVLSGITAPLIAYFGIRKGKLSKSFQLWWNVVCLLLVLQVVVTGILSAPSVLQQVAFDQPNVGVLYFPFCWLPSIVVPLVIFGHLVSIKRLSR